MNFGHDFETAREIVYGRRAAHPGYKFAVLTRQGCGTGIRGIDKSGVPTQAAQPSRMLRVLGPRVLWAAFMIRTWMV